MNEDKVKGKGETRDEAEGKVRSFGPNLNLNLIVVIGIVAVLLIAGGALLFTQVSSSPGCAGEGPCMLYFYADW